MMHTIARFVLVLLQGFSFIDAGWEDCLRKCENKDGNHTLPNVDFIYIINLEERVNKWKACQEQLEPYGIIPYRFNAINGWEMDERVLYQLGYPESMLQMTPGRIACLLSHLSILKDAYESGYNTIWVMEDDIEVIEHPLQIPDLIQSLDDLENDWDILYTDSDTKNYLGNRVPCLVINPRPGIEPKPLEFYQRKRPINEMFLEIGMRFGCYSMIIRRKGIEKILNYFSSYGIYTPIDMELFYVPGIKQVVIRRDIVSTWPGTPSDTTYPLPDSELKTYEEYLNKS